MTWCKSVIYWYLVKAWNLFQALSWRIGICTVPQLIIVEFCNELFRQWWDHSFLVIFFVQSIRSLLICLICLIVYSCMCCLWLYCVLFSFYSFAVSWFYVQLYNMYVWYVLLINDIHTTPVRYGFMTLWSYCAVEMLLLTCVWWFAILCRCWRSLCLTRYWRLTHRRSGLVTCPLMATCSTSWTVCYRTMMLWEECCLRNQNRSALFTSSSLKLYVYSLATFSVCVEWSGGVFAW